MSLRVFHALPDEGSASLKVLSEKTAAEEALLGRHPAVCVMQCLGLHISSSAEIGGCLPVSTATS